MDTGEQKLAELRAASLKDDDLMDFRCRECGECCHNRDAEERQIVLTAYDIFRIARHLGITAKEVTEKYGVPFEHPQTNVMHIRLKAKIHRGACAFLKNGRCSIHEAKPGVCAVFPMGRATNIRDNETLYFKNHTNCGKTDTSYPVKEWLDAFHLRESEEPVMAYTKCLAEIILALQKARKKPAGIIHIYHELVYRYLYQEYDTGKDFIPQIRRNTQGIIEVINDMKTWK